ncbi:MAG: hypothetical protein H0U63_03245 [Burkholderiales bacterium]|nr:hypothetical protein [Burkholderiales bacterium]
MKIISARERSLPRIAEAIAGLSRALATRTVTLTPSAAMTTVVEPKINSGSRVILVEQTANAAAAKYTTPWCLITPGDGSFVIAHANNAQADRVFLWVAIGE